MTRGVRRALILASAAVLTGYVGYRWSTRPIPFDRAQWLASENEDVGDPRNVRSRMVGDIVNRQVLPGMTLEEVLARLGREQEIHHPQGKPFQLHYFVFRYPNPFNLRNMIDDDYDLLFIDFGSDGRVKKAYRAYFSG